MGRKKGFDIIDPMVDFTKIGVGIPITYGVLGAGASIPGAGPAIAGVLPHMGTSYNLMGSIPVVKTSRGLLKELKKLK